MSIVVPECYEYIVGLSRTNCECYDPPADAETSLSGLYIDELESLAGVLSSVNCENGADVFEQLARSRQIAITTFQADTNALMMKGFKLKRQNYYGSIGRAVSKKNLTQTAGEYYGVRMYCANVKSGILQINAIGTVFSQTGTITLLIYNNLGDLISSHTLDTEASKHKKTTVDIELPLHSPYIENMEYYFIYQAGANVARDNDLKCNCGGFKAVFNIDKPYYNHVQLDRNYMWSNWLMAGGYHSVDIPEQGLCTHTTNNTMYGLTFDVELKCKINEVLCYESLDFESNNLAGAMAIAIQHKAATILGSWIVNSGNLNRFTLINTEQLIADVEKWNQVYIDMTKFVAEQVDISVNDCLACRDIYEMAKRGIMA